jgi:hypothetical protein
MGGGGGGGGGACEIIITSNPRRLSSASCAPSAPSADNTMKAPSPKALPIRIINDEKQTLSKLGKLIYTTKAGDTFTAYHSAVFPKIVNESDKIVYDNKERWYQAMRVSAPIQCD